MSETAIIALIAAIPLILAGITKIIVSIRSDVRKVHMLVNSQKDVLEKRIKELEANLGEALKKSSG